jgi:hypothetical protein
MDRPRAVEKLRWARERLESALARAHVIDGRDGRGLAESVGSLTADADAELATACTLLELDPPPAQLIPTMSFAELDVWRNRGDVPRWLHAEWRAWRVRRWIRARALLVTRLLAEHDHAPDARLYR